MLAHKKYIAFSLHIVMFLTGTEYKSRRLLDHYFRDEAPKKCSKVNEVWTDSGVSILVKLSSHQLLYTHQDDKCEQVEKITSSKVETQEKGVLSLVAN